MTQSTELARYEALDPLAKRYVEVAAKAMYLSDRGLDGQPAGTHWEDVASVGNGQGDADTVADYRVKALKVVEALADVTREEPAGPVQADTAATVDLTKSPKDVPAEIPTKIPETADA